MLVAKKIKIEVSEQDAATLECMRGSPCGVRMFSPESKQGFNDESLDVLNRGSTMSLKCLEDIRIHLEEQEQHRSQEPRV